MSPPVELTLVVAATRAMGIGAKGTLPWTGLRKEMAYFARVTKRLPPEVAHPPVLYCCFSLVFSILSLSVSHLWLYCLRLLSSSRATKCETR